MPSQIEEKGEETRQIKGQQVSIKWRKANYGEYLAWCYLPGEQMLFNQGVGFDARAKSPEKAIDAVANKAKAHLSQN